ncbi:MAG: chorismate pyruvate-lyase family protein [Gammaproteobacteria bacterium]|nr:chorismate pyruvate-lyase family protein [Gammaproteobacteria bacterium]
MANDIPVPRQTTSAPYDPAAGLFLAQHRRPAHLAGVESGELSPLQRALLVIDGTVTSFLSAWALEPVIVRPLAQRSVVLPDDAGPAGGQSPAAHWLDGPAGTPVMERAVLLVGADSQRLFAFAESVICLGRLPATLRAGLESGGLSLGQLLLMPGFESRREGLWYGRERPAKLPPAVAALTTPDFLTRTYRVSSASQPLMVITERFPWSLRG